MAPGAGHVGPGCGAASAGGCGRHVQQRLAAGLEGRPPLAS